MDVRTWGLRLIPRGRPRQEEGRWVRVVGALLLLVFMAAFFRWASANLADARRELGSAQQRLNEARQEEARTIELAKRAQMAMGLMREAHAGGLGSAAWAERRFNIKQATMSRSATNALLSEMQRSPDRLFGAEEFSLSVRRSSEGLFSNVADPASEVEVTVRGSLLFRTTGSRF